MEIEGDYSEKDSEGEGEVMECNDLSLSISYSLVRVLVFCTAYLAPLRASEASYSSSAASAVSLPVLT